MDRAKEQALRCVDEIIKANPTNFMYDENYSKYTPVDRISSIGYWEEVKKHLR